jgi:RimJ/RimL family protein N-acetyltransferase
MILTLHSERLTLSPYEAADIDLSIEMFTDPEVVKYAGGVIGEKKIRDQMADVTRRGGNGCVGIWCISMRRTGEKIGSAALLPMPVEEKHTDYSLVIPGQMPEGDIEIGYFLKRSAWGKGYATEACKRLVQMAFEDSPLTEVVANFEDGNVASRNVLEKLGLVNHGTMRCYGDDGPNYRLTRDDWLAVES